VSCRSGFRSAAIFWGEVDRVRSFQAQRGVEVTIGGVEVTREGVEVTIGGIEVTIGGIKLTIGGVEVTMEGVEVTIVMILEKCLGEF
jgi:hypothetical protein